MPHEPVAAPYGHRRGTVVIDPDAGVRLIERRVVPVRPTGDLVQAGPLLVADGEIVFDTDVDRVGFRLERVSSTPTSRRGAIRARRSGSLSSG